MKLKQLTLKQSLNKAYRLIKPGRAEIEKFKANFKLLLEHINPQESEENLKGHIMNFLKNTYYTPDYHIATKGRTDFVIHTGKNAAHPAGVLFEAKKGTNNEMVTRGDLNRKAMHEIMLYYLRERIEHHNNDIRYIVITNIYEWFLFDAPEFERLFFKNSFLIKEYKAWMAKQKVSTNNDLFYNEIAKPFLAALTEEIEFTYFDIRDFEKHLRDSDKENDNELIPLFKVFSPTHLLKLSFANDSNSLDKGFYNELLYLIGLEEVKEGNKKIIRRKQQGKRNDGSLIENAIVQLNTENCIHKVTDRNSYGDTIDEQKFSVALELCITWVNRILFLKLLEAQLLKYHKGNPEYKFLNYNIIRQYDELYKLFFLVLAKKQNERTEKVKVKYRHIPYLNSSLFDRTVLEEQTIRINMLDDEAEMRLDDKTVLKDDKNKPIAAKLNTLQYFFEFLNAYDFASEGSEEIQEERKTLINASVLGLIFEKINGYKDGSIFTPGFITMYMCRQSIRQAVLHKFKEKYNWKAETFEDLHNYISDDRSAKTILSFNTIINSLTICDPAVGSGHFLVSALNELIAIKSELGILADAKGKRLSDHTATVENDELLITDREKNFFTYYVTARHGQITIPDAEMQRVQETLFHEKQTLIENCLFGVDINPKSVQICRLRLWIELLKNAYYIAPSPLERAGSEVLELQTLPNIDINIKTGNSLISRFALDEDLKAVLKQGKYSVETYKLVVQTYKDSRSKEEKSQLQDFVRDLKEQFKTIVYLKDPLRNKIQQLRGDLLLLTTANIDLFGKKKTDSEVKDEVKKLELSIAQKEKELEEKEKSRIYNNAFEWRFEFPEVLDNEGSFIGFDVVIGNPPYIGISNDKSLKFLFHSYEAFDSTGDIYCLFYELGSNLIKNDGLLFFISSNKWLRAHYGKKLRNYFIKKTNPLLLFDFSWYQVFDNASVDSNLLLLKKDKYQNELKGAVAKKGFKIEELEQYIQKNSFPTLIKVDDFWSVSDTKFLSLKNKLEGKGKTLNKWNFQIYRGLLTGLNEAFIINTELKNKFVAEDKNNSKIIKPLLRGRDIERYGYEFAGLWLINSHNGLKEKGIPAVNVEKDFPVIYKHLRNFEGAAEVRADKGMHWTNLRNCAYLEEFLKEKLLWAETMRVHKTGDRNFPRFGYDNGEYYTDKTVFIGVGEHLKYLLAVFNSKVGRYLIQLYVDKLDTGGYMMQKAFLDKIPMYYPISDEDVPFVSIVNQILSIKKENPKADTSQLENQIDELVYKLYNLTSEEIEIIEQSTK